MKMINGKFKNDERSIKEKVKDGFNDMVVFFESHPMVAIMLVSTGVSLTKVAVKGICDVRKAKLEIASANSIYDRSLNARWQLRRPLTNEEMTILESRKNEGEKLGDILESMKVLR